MSLTEPLALFGAGIASFLAPCVVPLVPAYVGMIAGEAAGARAPRSSGGADAGPRLVGASVLFVGGFTGVFVVLGAVAGGLGGFVGTPVVLQRVGGVVIAAFGLLLLAGALGIGPRRELRLVTELPDVGPVVRPLVIGVAFGAAWTPCVGPLLGAALTVATRSATAGRGAVLLAAYGLGIGVPFVAVALAISSWPAFGTRLARVSRVGAPIAALCLVALGVLLSAGWYSRVISPIARVLPGGA